MRLIAVERAWSAPATALSTHWPPALLYASANWRIAADSPPEVHQWITLAFSGSAACATMPYNASAATTPRKTIFLLFIPSPVDQSWRFSAYSGPMHDSAPGF